MQDGWLTSQQIFNLSSGKVSSSTASAKFGSPPCKQTPFPMKYSNQIIWSPDCVDIFQCFYHVWSLGKYILEVVGADIFWQRMAKGLAPLMSPAPTMLLLSRLQNGHNRALRVSSASAADGTTGPVKHLSHHRCFMVIVPSRCSAEPVYCQHKALLRETGSDLIDVLLFTRCTASKRLPLTAVRLAYGGGGSKLNGCSVARKQEGYVICQQRAENRPYHNGDTDQKFPVDAIYNMHSHITCYPLV